MTAPIGALSVGAMPNISTPALPGVVPSSGAQLAQAIGQAPQLIAQQQLQSATTQDQLAQLDDKRLAQIVQFARSNPAYAQDPRIVQTVDQIFKRRNLPAPIIHDQGGQRVDLSALLPKRGPQDMTDTDLTFFTGLPAEQRASVMQAKGYDPALFDPSFISGAPVQPVNAGEKTALITMLPRLFQNIADPKSGGPQAVAGMLKQLAPLYQRVLGVSPEAMFDDPNLVAALSQRAAIGIQKEVELGIIHPQEADRIAAERVQAQIDQFRTKFAETQKVDDAKINRMNIQSQVEQAREQRLALAQDATLNLKAQQIQANINHLNALTGGEGYKQFTGATKPFLDSYKAVKTAYDKDIASLKAATISGNASADDVLQTTTGQKKPDGTDLTIGDRLIMEKKQLDDLQPTYDAIQTRATHWAAHTMGAVVPGIQKIVPIDKGKNDSFTVGQTYTDAHNRKAKYLGGGKWQTLP